MLTDDELKKIGEVVETKIGDVIQDVVIPAMDNLEKELGQRLDNVESRLGSVETRLNSLDNKADLILDKVNTHEKRIQKLEKPAQTLI